MISGSSARPGDGSHARLHQLPNVRKEIHQCDMSSRSDLAHLTRSSPGKPPLARLVEMIADQLPKRNRVIELELHRERHDVIRHAFTAVQASKILFRRYQCLLLAPRLRSEGCYLLVREHVMIGKGARAREVDAAGAQRTEEPFGIADAGERGDRSPRCGG